MLDRVILHIGTHKTGTTAVQGSLGEASDALLSRGVLYPRSGRRGVGHVELARLAEHPGEMPGGREGEQELLEEIRAASPGTLVLSAERFTSPVSPRRARWAEWLCTHLDARRVEVIGYVRPQWEYIESIYVQATKAGLTRVDSRVIFSRPWRTPRPTTRPYSPLGGGCSGMGCGSGPTRPSSWSGATP